MGKSLDAAGLAAGRVALDANAEDVAQQYFDANFGKSSEEIKITDFDFQVDESCHYVTLTADRRGADALHARLRRRHDERRAPAPSSSARPRGMELALVMDNTGSMWNSDTDRHCRHAVRGDAKGRPRPRRHHLRQRRQGRQRLGQPRSLRRHGQHRPQPHRLAGSGRPRADQPVELPARPHRRRLEGLRDGAGLSLGHRRLDAIGAPLHLVLLRGDLERQQLADHQRRPQRHQPARKGPNLGCATPITPLTASKTTIKAGINAMRPWRRGGTTGNLGLAWGWRTLSPSWRGLWGNADLPLDYSALHGEGRRLLTDGNNEFYDLPSQDTAIRPGDPRRRRTSPPTAGSTRRVRSAWPSTTTADGVAVLN